MRVSRFEIATVDIPLRMSVEHALAKRTAARNVLVRAEGEDGTSGWGECCPREYVTGETLESVRRDLAERILPRLEGRALGSLAEAAALLTEVLDDLARDQLAAFCAAELAMLDLVGKATGRSAGEVLGPVRREQARYSGVIATSDLEEVRAQATAMREFRVADVKVKVGASLEKNREILETVRGILGDEIRLRLDANAAWTSDEAIRQLRELAGFAIAGIEQPVAREDLAGMAAVTAERIAPVVADETLCSLADARELIERRGCDVLNVRVSKCGGLINSGRIERLGREAGLASQLGAQVGETGILSAAGRHLATRCDPIWCEGSYGSLLLEQDITHPDLTVGPGGWAPALDAPGLGVAPVPERLEACRVDTPSMS